MGKLPWYCTITGLENSVELRTEKIRPTVSEICIPEPADHPAAPRSGTTLPLQADGLRGKRHNKKFKNGGLDYDMLTAFDLKHKYFRHEYLIS